MFGSIINVLQRDETRCKKDFCWPGITPGLLNIITCAVHSAVQCRQQLWATAQLLIENVTDGSAIEWTADPANRCGAEYNILFMSLFSFLIFFLLLFINKETSI